MTWQSFEDNTNIYLSLAGLVWWPLPLALPYMQNVSFKEIFKSVVLKVTLLRMEATG